MEPSTKLGPYRLEEQLGFGGMGVVWRAWDERLQRRVAVKQFRADARIANLRERLRREALAVARLNHSSIVHIYDIVESDGGDWIVMEFVEGMTLRRLLDQGPLPLPRVTQLGREIAEGLAEAHAHGILHRDLKASNVMVTSAGRAKILDFGLAKQLPREDEAAVQELTLSAPGTILGTCYAMSPEQVLGQPVDARSDLFSLGSLLYEMFSGQAPFHGETPTSSLARVLSLRPPPLRRVRAEVPQRFSNLVESLLEKEPALRPQSAREVVETLAGAPPSAAASPQEPSRAASLSPAGDSSVTIAEGPAWAPLALPENAPPTGARSHRRRQIGERRMLTVVCCGLIGTTGESSGETGSLDLEVLSEAMEAFQGLARTVSDQFGGHLGAVVGHLLWIYFGYLQTKEDDAQRAVHTARELVARTDGLGKRFRLAGGQRLAARAAVHTGPAVVMVRPGQEDQPQLASTLDVATEMQAVAPVGSVVVSASSQRLIARSFTTEALAPTRLRGLDGPVILHQVLGAADPLQRDTGALTLLVGREREVDLLLDRLHMACSGTGQAMMVAGEAGIGKSRLVQALRERLAASDLTWLVAYGSPYTQSSPFAPIVNLLERLAFSSANQPSGSSASDDNAGKLGRLEEFLGQHGLSPEEAVPLLAPLLSLSLEGRYPPLALNPEEQRKRTFEILRTLFAVMAERRPLSLVIEDLHWSDPSTLELLGLLLDDIAASPLSLLATFRPDFQAPWGHRAHLTQLTLNRLSDSETTVLIDHLAEGKALPAGVRRQILVKTDGVPLFVEELTKAVLEAQWAGEQTEIPSTLSGSLAARLDRLGPAKEVAQIASVIGRTFSPELLTAISPLDPAALQNGLDELVRAELVYRRGSPRRASYSFKHALVQDAAYASLLHKDRRELHLRTAEVLEAQLQDSAKSHSETPGGDDIARLLLLAHHWREAVDMQQPDAVPIGKSVAHLVSAGEQALRLNAYQEAHTHLTQALELVVTLPTGDPRDEQELVVRTRLGTVLKAIRGWASVEVKEVYDAARELCVRSGNRRELPHILFGLWQYHLFHVQYEESLTFARECLEHARQTELADLLMAHCALTNSLFWLARVPESLRHAEEVLKHSTSEIQAYGIKYGYDPRIHAAEFSVFSLHHLGKAEEALARHDATLELAETLAQPFTLAIALATSVTFHRDRHDVPAVREAAEKMIDLTRESGFPIYEIIGKTFRNWALAEEGKAAEVIDETLPLIEAPGKLGLALRCCLWVTVCQRAGRLDDAFTGLEKGLATVRENNELAYEAELYCLQAELLLERAKTNGGPAPHRKEAEASLRHALDLACQRLQVPFAERASGLLISLLEGQQETEEIQDRVRKLREEASATAQAVLQEVGVDVWQRHLI